MTLFTGSARLTFDCDRYPDKDTVRRLLGKRYAGTALSYTNLRGSANTEGYYYTTVSGVFDVSPDFLCCSAPAQALTTVLHSDAIDKMFLAEDDERIEYSERFEWVRPIDMAPIVSYQP